jgi:hypothetical protein
MAAKHARHDMRKDKNFKGSDPSELTAQSLYCGKSFVFLEHFLMQEGSLAAHVSCDGRFTSWFSVESDFRTY